MSIIFLKRSFDLKPYDNASVLWLIKEHIKMNNLLNQAKVDPWKESDQIWVPTEKNFISTLNALYHELHKISNFAFRNSLVNATKSTVSDGFGHI